MSFSFVSFFIVFVVFVRLLVHLVHFGHLIMIIRFVFGMMNLLVLIHFTCKLRGLRMDLLRRCRVGCHGGYGPSIFLNLLVKDLAVSKYAFLSCFCFRKVSLLFKVSLFVIGCRSQRIAFEHVKEFLNLQSLGCGF